MTKSTLISIIFVYIIYREQLNEQICIYGQSLHKLHASFYVYNTYISTYIICNKIIINIINMRYCPISSLLIT